MLETILMVLHCVSSVSLANLFYWEGSKTETIFQMQPHQCPAEGNKSFPQPAGYALISAAVYEVILHHNKGCLIHVQSGVNQTSGPSLQSCCQASQPLASTVAWGCLLPLPPLSPTRCRILYLSLFTNILLAHSSSLANFSRMGAVPSAYQSLPPHQVSNIHRIPGHVGSPTTQLPDGDVTLASSGTPPGKETLSC